MATETRRVGFIGLGVMGEPMCRNLAVKTKLDVVALDLDPRPLERLAAQGVRNGGSVRGVVEGSDVVFLSLPSGEAVDELAHAADGLLAAIGAGPDRGRPEHLAGAYHAPAGAGVRRARGELHRCAGRAYARGRRGRHARGDGRRRAGGIRESASP